jgi:predicted ABC-type sugar transport system permease subunit
MTDSERPIGFVLRVLLAVIGLSGILAAFVVAAAEFQSVTRPAFLPALLLACFCLVIVFGSVLLVRGAVLGRIRFRRTRHRN